MSVIEPTKRWDPIVKLTHWGVASAVIANALFTEEGSGWHVWVGYALAGLLLLRWLWGFVGTRNARFSDRFDVRRHDRHHRGPGARA